MKHTVDSISTCRRRVSLERFSICPTPYYPPDKTTSDNSPPLGPNGPTYPGNCLGVMVTGGIEPYIRGLGFMYAPMCYGLFLTFFVLKIGEEGRGRCKIPVHMPPEVVLDEIILKLFKFLLIDDIFASCCIVIIYDYKFITLLLNYQSCF